MANRSKEYILDLEQNLNKEVFVKFLGGREIKGILRSFDPLVNLVMDDCVEFMRDSNTGEGTRYLGQVLCRGIGIMTLSPMEGFEQLSSNPFEETEIIPGQ